MKAQFGKLVSLILVVILLLSGCVGVENSENAKNEDATGKGTTTSTNITSSTNEPTTTTTTTETTTQTTKKVTTTESKTQITRPSISTTKKVTTTTTTQSSRIPREPLPDGVVYGYEWLENFARAATEEELRAHQKRENLPDHLVWCEDCGRPVLAMTIDGKLMVCGAIYGTCMSQIGSGDWKCECCNAVVPARSCHTCGVPIEIEPLPGTPVNSPSQLTDTHKESLWQYALSDLEGRYELKDDETLVSLYSFVLTDNFALSSKSECVCFFVFTSVKPYSSKPVYHSGKIIDMYISEDGLLRGAVLSNEFETYENEEEAVAHYKKIGRDIQKIK